MLSLIPWSSDSSSGPSMLCHIYQCLNQLSRCVGKKYIIPSLYTWTKVLTIQFHSPTILMFTSSLSENAVDSARQAT